MSIEAEKPRFKHRLEYAGLYLVFLLSRIVPKRASLGVGAWVGRVVFDVLKIRRDVALSNLRFVFDQTKSEQEIVDLGRRSYEQLGRSLMEFAQLYSSSPEERLARVRIENTEYLEQMMADGNGCVMVTGHYGNWEMFGSALAAHGYKTTYIVKRQHNPYSNRMQEELRRRGGINTVEEGPFMSRAVLRALRSRHIVGVLPDQDARRHGVFVNFLGRPASTFKGPAFFAYRANVPLFAGFIRRLEDGNHVATLLAPIHPDPSRPQEEEIERLTQAYSDQMSEWIRRYPENYFWVHRRWKTKPPRPAAGAVGPGATGPGAAGALGEG